MINVSRAILHPKLSQTFSLFRRTSEFVRGRPSHVESEIKFRGIITPAKTQEIEMIPEGDRVGGEIVIYSTEKLCITSESGASDELLWNDERYKIYAVQPYKDYGYYKAIAVRKESC